MTPKPNGSSIQLVQTESTDLARLYQEEMTQHFPPEELKPIHRLQGLHQKGYYRIPQLISEAAETLAYAFLFRLPDDDRVVLLDYLAVADHSRGQGLGSQMIRAIHETHDQHLHLLAEIEDPHASSDPVVKEERLRRWNFYRRLGFVDTGIRTCLFGVPFVILLSTNTTHTAELSTIELSLSNIYRVMYQGTREEEASLRSALPAERLHDLKGTTDASH